MSAYGRLAYGAYAERADGKAFNGEPLRHWTELGERIQDCWHASAGAVETETRASIAEELRDHADRLNDEFDDDVMRVMRDTLRTYARRIEEPQR